MVATVEQIERAAVDWLGVEAARVNRYEVQPHSRGGRRLFEFDTDEAGVWFMLFVKHSVDSPWEALGRRRMRSALAEMIDNRGRISRSCGVPR